MYRNVFFFFSNIFSKNGSWEWMGEIVQERTIRLSLLSIHFAQLSLPLSQSKLIPHLLPIQVSSEAKRSKHNVWGSYSLQRIVSFLFALLYLKGLWEVLRCDNLIINKKRWVPLYVAHLTKSISNIEYWCFKNLFRPIFNFDLLSPNFKKSFFLRAANNGRWHECGAADWKVL